MAFILSFVILTLAVPLTLELYKRRGDNIVSRAGREIAESKLVRSVTARMARGVGSLGDLKSGALSVAALVLGITAVWLILRILWAILSFIVGLFTR